MSFKSIGKKYSIILNKDTSGIEPINFADIIIPFSEFGELKSSSDIYEGSEKIPFRKRNSLYQTILKNEFADSDLCEIHQNLIKINYLITKLSD